MMRNVALFAAQHPLGYVKFMTVASLKSRALAPPMSLDFRTAGGRRQH